MVRYYNMKFYMNTEAFWSLHNQEDFMAMTGWSPWQFILCASRHFIFVCVQIPNKSKFYKNWPMQGCIIVTWSRRTTEKGISTEWANQTLTRTDTEQTLPLSLLHKVKVKQDLGSKNKSVQLTLSDFNRKSNTPFSSLHYMLSWSWVN